MHLGAMHFPHPEPFVRIVPDYLRGPLFLVYASGFCEIGLGALLLPERTRRLAGWGLVALYVAVFPANVYMATEGIQLDPESAMPAWVAWARLPFQLVFIAWALWVSAPDHGARASG